MVGQAFLPWAAASSRRSSSPRIGCWNFISTSRRISHGPNTTQINSAVMAANTARNVVY